MKLLVKNSDNPMKVAYVKKMIEYSSRILFPDLISDVNYKILVRLTTKLEYGWSGEACWYGERINPKKCYIELNDKLKIYRLTQVIFHEMVHVKQFFRSELCALEFRSKNDYVWKHELYRVKDENYWLLPWEIEAYGFETCIYNTFIDEFDFPLKLNKLDFSAVMAKMDEH